MEDNASYSISSGNMYYFLWKQVPFPVETLSISWETDTISSGNRIHIYLIDCQEQDPLGIFKTLKNELNTFNKGLDKKPYLICRTKSDLNTEISSNWDRFNENILDISSVSHVGLDLLVDSIVKLL